MSSSILVVDDDPSIRSLFQRALARLGDVDTAPNGAEALRLLHAKKYALVVLDLHMPIMDGFVVLHTLTGKPGPNRETPVIVVTADTSDSARVRALHEHALFFLNKPVPLATLGALAETALKKGAHAHTESERPPSRPTPTPPTPRKPS